LQFKASDDEIRRALRDLPEVEQLLGVVYWRGRICLVCEYLPFGDLDMAINNGSLSLAAKVSIALNLIKK
jgi:hypothetical protein